MLDAGVGISIEKDSYKAGRKVAQEALNAMNSKPKLAILAVDSLTRRAYNYNEILKGVREEIGTDIILIGSTVNGILVGDRFALKSVGLMLIGGDFTIDNSYNFPKSRLEYEKIAEKVYQDSLNLTPNDNRFMLIFLDGLKFPKEVLDKQKSLNSRFVSLFSGLVRKMFMKQLEEFKEKGLGVSSAQELLESLYAKGWKWSIIGNAATNVRNYDSVEFYNDEVGDDNFIGAVISPIGSTKFGLGYSAGAEYTGNSATVNKNIGSFLLRIDGKPALKGLCDAANIKIESLKELKSSDYLNYYNIVGTTEKSNDKEVIHLVATMTNPDLESLIITGFPFNKVPKEIQIFQSNMKILHKTAQSAVSQALNNLSEPKFLLGFDCGIRFFAYGDNLPNIVKTIDDTIGKDIPRMIVGSGGEIFGRRDLDFYFNNMTFITLAGGD
ncbi:MAG: FIST N-terminal domain-containing protein [Promethearchaeota archaeon]